MNKFLRDIGIMVIGVLTVSAVIGAINNHVKLSVVDQREKLHYEDILELKKDIRDIKNFLYTGDKKHLSGVENGRLYKYN